jgi:TolB-like protein
MLFETVSHYKIVAELGKGGMGVIYKAEDLKLGRAVALKFLPPDLVRDEEARARFTREAQAASALDHPNICTIYEIDETDDGRVFIAMACYEGETLRQKIENGPLAVDEIIGITKQIAQGLSKAHRAGIVHRDIKPANIIVTNDGLVKILDFGLAKLADQNQITKTGAAIGTVAYMSPEQAGGDEIDQRTDIWSLGVLMYEMLTGRLPFKGDSNIAVIRAILDDTPIDIHESRKDVPAYLRQIVATAMHKQAQERYGDVADLIGALDTKEEPVAPVLKESKSIVVLPFKNVSPEKDNEYFADGLTEEIIHILSRVRALKVISSTSAMTFKDSDKDVRDIARELNVEYVLEGSVRKSEDDLRITTKLIGASDGYTLWSERFDRDMGNLFDIQDEIALAIVDKLEMNIIGSEKAALTRHTTDDPEVYNLCLLGRHHTFKFSEKDLELGKDYFERAIAIDSNCAPAHVGLTLYYLLMGGSGLNILPPKVAIPKAKAAAERALQADPDNCDAHCQLMLINLWYMLDMEAAKRHIEHALELNPNSAEAHRNYAHYLTNDGRPIEAIEVIKQAIKFDPISSIHYQNAAWHCYVARRWDETLDFAARALELDENLAHAEWLIAAVYLETGRLKEALAILERISAKIDLFKPFLGQAYAKVGMVADAMKIIRDFEVRRQAGESNAIMTAMVHAGLGNADEAVRFIRIAISERPVMGPFASFIKCEPAWWDNIRNHPGFRAIVAGETEPSDEKSIVVLPFDDLSQDKDNAYFSDGLTEEIISDLSGIHDLRVISRTSSMMLKGTDKSLADIARELKVQYVLEGSVRKAGDNLRITAQLIEASTDMHLWAEKYNGTLDDIFGIQEEVSRKIVKGLKVELTPQEESKLAQHPIPDARAYEFYHLARHHVLSMKKEDIDRAERFIEQGLEITGENALLLAGLGYVKFQRINGGFSPSESVDEVEDLVKRAFRLEPDLVQGHVLLGLVNQAILGDQQKSIAHFKKALEISPNDPDALLWICVGYTVVGRFDKGLRLAKRLGRIDPLHPWSRAATAQQHFFGGNFQLAAELVAEANLRPFDDPVLGLYTGPFYFFANHPEQAQVVLGQAMQTDTSEAFPHLCGLLKYSFAKDRKKVEELETSELHETYSEYFKRDPHLCWFMALYNAVLGRKEKSMDYLEHGKDCGFINYPFLAEHDPVIGTLHGEERFEKFLEEVKVLWENFEA